MNFKKLTFATLVTATIAMTGCPSDDTTGAETDTDPTTMTGTMSMTGMTDPTTTGMTMSGTDPDTTETDPTNPTETDSDTDTDTDTTGPDPNIFDFREDDPDAYTRVDRKGFPGVNTALITEENKDAYNAANPADDAPAGTFAGDAVGIVQFLHVGTDPGDSTGLNDDLALANTLLGTDLTPCGTTKLNNSCFQQAVPLAFPDVLLINTGAPTGFPNGRTLEVPVIDIILAALLIDIEGDPANLAVFADLAPDDDEVHGLSQSPNDVEFPGAFPYLAPAQ